MKKLFNFIGALAAALVVPLAALASNTPMPSVPAIPVVVYGSVKIDGALAPVGTKVTAEAGSGEVAALQLAQAGSYSLSISQDRVAVGSAVKFRINGKEAGQLTMVSVDERASVQQDLAITTSSSSGGSGSGGRTNPTTPTTPTVPATEETEATLGEEEGQVLGATSVEVRDGDIIQCRNSANPNAVYIVKLVGEKKFIRHIVSLEIFNFYAHLKWENLIQVETLDGFSLSGWVRVNTGANGQPGPSDKVYEINGDQTRHWIDMTAEEFLQHGGSEEAIYAINQGELNLYREGPAVKLM